MRPSAASRIKRVPVRTVLLAVLAFAASQPNRPAIARPQEPIPTYFPKILATYPHDDRAFTQGLFWLDGCLYESTGKIGRSTIRRVSLEDGRVVQAVDIPKDSFGEGIVNWGNEIISVNWQGGVGFRWDRTTLRRLGEWRYPGEGWGLTQNGREIIMSDGTNQLRFLDPETLTERRRIAVTANGDPVRMLNELEWVKGEILANVWLTPMIARIDPASGRVTGWIDLGALVSENSSGSDDVLNGIAYDAANDRLFVTGKYWPRLYEIDLIARAPSR